MSRASLTIPCLCLLALTCLARAADTDLANVPEPTRKLYDKFAADYHADSQDAAARSVLVQQLAAAPDADLCFLHEIEAHLPTWRTEMAAREQLAKLNTQRTFDILTGRLKSENAEQRGKALWAISAFRRPESVPLLIGVLEADKDDHLQVLAAEYLKDLADPRAQPALLKAARSTSPELVAAAVASLAPLKSKEGLAIAVEVMDKARGWQREQALEVVASYHTKGAVNALLTEYVRLCAAIDRGDKDDDWLARLHESTAARLEQEIPTALPELGFSPERYLDEWQDWWARAAPLLTDDLTRQVNVQKPAPRQWPDAEFAKTTDDISLHADVDAKTFRLGDPIRVDLTLANHGKNPCSLVMPALPSGWMPTMAYGIKLKRGETLLADLAPSAYYLGSYSGPPAFQTLAPGEEFHSSICFQYWADYLFSLPLPEGDYELTITFDSSKYADISPQGIQLVHRWQAPAIKFTIQGEARKDPQEMLALIAEKAHRKFLLHDLTSSQMERHDSAWWFIFEYGDSRLAEFVEKFEQDHPDRTYHYHNAADLRPFTQKALKDRGL